MSSMCIAIILSLELPSTFRRALLQIAGSLTMRDAERVQRTSLHCRFHPAVRALVLEVQHQLPPPGGDDARAQLRRSSHNHLSLDPNVRPAIGEADPLVSRPHGLLVASR